ncbi:MAG: DUF86 domain-containing protein [Deltaproteobacteria bacterium]|nr:DUF86 domain-containing protein [Deltaproteobacteria bacterium]
MVDFDRAAVHRKLALLLGYADELHALVGRSGPGPAGNVARRAVERLVQLVVEVSVDVNDLLAASASLPPPATARDSFQLAARLGVLTAGLSSRFVASYVGLRNRIVHDYERLDDRLVLRAARRLVADARAFAAAVGSYLSRPAPSEVRERAPRYRVAPSRGVSSPKSPGRAGRMRAPARRPNQTR